MRHKLQAEIVFDMNRLAPSPDKAPRLDTFYIDLRVYRLKWVPVYQSTFLWRGIYLAVDVGPKR